MRHSGYFMGTIWGNKLQLNLPHMQEAWIQHATVKENILFGQPFDSEKYNAVVFTCALEKVCDRGPEISRMMVVGWGVKEGSETNVAYQLQIMMLLNVQ